MLFQRAFARDCGRIGATTQYNSAHRGGEVGQEGQRQQKPAIRPGRRERSANFKADVWLPATQIHPISDGGMDTASQEKT